MKTKVSIKLFFIAFSTLLITTQLYAQVPQKMSYQAIVRDADNKLVESSAVGVKISILQGSEDGSAVYIETHTAETNENGLFSIEVGTGSGSYDFSDINWANGPYFIKSEVDVSGGSSYSISGVSQLLSVPFALYSQTAANMPDGQNFGDMLYWDGSEWAVIPVGKNGHAMILCNGVPTWGGCDEDENEPIFVVENNQGVEVFAVYRDGVVVKIQDFSDDPQKTSRGGFAVGGFTTNKEDMHEYLLVTPDSVRVYIKTEDETKTSRGGFAVGGFTTNKEGGKEDYFKVTSDTVYISNTLLAGEDIQVGGDINVGGDVISKPVVATLFGYLEEMLYLEGEIVDDGNSTITEVGFYYGETMSPEIDGTKVNGEIVEGGLFTAFVDPTDLLPFTTYYFTAFARNSAGAGFGEMLSFQTLEGPPVVLTATPADVSWASALVGGEVTNDGGYEVTERGILYGTSPALIEEGVAFPIGEGTGVFSGLLSGLESSTEYFVMAYANNLLGISYGSTVQFTTTEPDDGQTGTMIDQEGNIYQTIIINGREWMAENLRTATYLDGIPIDFPGDDNILWNGNTTGAYAWYNNDINWREIYGGLYTGNAVLNPSGLCPAGWVIPTEEDMFTLFDNAGGLSDAGGPLKSTRTAPDEHPRWDEPNDGATNATGFSGLPGGDRRPDGTYNDLGQLGKFWSSTPFGDDQAYYFHVSYNNTIIGYGNTLTKAGFSVRCIKE